MGVTVVPAPGAKGLELDVVVELSSALLSSRLALGWLLTSE